MSEPHERFFPQMPEKLFKKLVSGIRAYNKSGEIEKVVEKHPILVLGFDQCGDWVGFSRDIISEERMADFDGELRHSKLPKSLISSGGRLLTSYNHFVNKLGVGTAKIKWESIAGNVYTYSKNISAPNLRWIGGFLNAPYAITVDAPNLFSVGITLHLPIAKTFNAKLRSVGLDPVFTRSLDPHVEHLVAQHYAKTGKFDWDIFNNKYPSFSDEEIVRELSEYY